MELATKSEVQELLEADREVHFYGLGDLSNVFWNRSRWWVRNGVAIGEIGLSDDPADITVYGINTGDPDAALALWAEVDPMLPDRYFATGVSGFTDVLADAGRIIELDLGDHTKMILSNRAALGTAAYTGGVRPLTQQDLAAIEDLHKADPVDSAFFAPDLLEVGPFYGIFDGDQLIAMAGVHVCDNQAARRIYAQLGYEDIHTYQEALVVRQ